MPSICVRFFDRPATASAADPLATLLVVRPKQMDHLFKAVGRPAESGASIYLNVRCTFR